jgi:hypothetical protein
MIARRGSDHDCVYLRIRSNIPVILCQLNQRISLTNRKKRLMINVATCHKSCCGNLREIANIISSPVATPDNSNIYHFIYVLLHTMP